MVEVKSHQDALDNNGPMRQLFALYAADAESVTMKTGSHVVSVGAGDSLQLDCEFDAATFNLFDNPVLWRKTQGNETTQLNTVRRPPSST